MAPATDVEEVVHSWDGCRGSCLNKRGQMRVRCPKTRQARLAVRHVRFPALTSVNGIAVVLG